MNPAPSSTFFSSAPHWEWLIVLYFFFGGLAGGSYFLAVLIDLFGSAEDRPLARLGYYVAFPLVVVCGLLLTVDLGRPLRFWHMMIERNTFTPMFKYWSPMSIGSWALLIFGFFAFVSFVLALADTDRLPRAAARRVRVPLVLRKAIAVIGGLFGFYIAGYTGVLLAVTNRPIWSDTPLLGMLFTVSAASTSAALLILLAHRYGWATPAVAGLHRMDAWMLVLELIVLVAVVVSLGPVVTAWLNAWGVLLVVGVVIVGLLLPLALTWRPQLFRGSTAVARAVLVLIGGFLLRVVIVLSSESV
jgi:formate-dependent nitrite reductase membrane component NrfD